MRAAGEFRGDVKRHVVTVDERLLDLHAVAVFAVEPCRSFRVLGIPVQVAAVAHLMDGQSRVQHRMTVLICGVVFFAVRQMAMAA